MSNAAQRKGLVPQGAVCLTFDDGPGETEGEGSGPRTFELAEYLASENIPATFFMCGKHVDAYPQIPAQVLGFGHRIGNHTHNHPSLSLEPHRTVQEIKSCLESLRAAGINAPALPFRAPYGHWAPANAAALASNPALDSAVAGVYCWDIDGEDWATWDAGGEDWLGLADKYFNMIAAANGGMVLMHDSTADPGEDGVRRRAGNRTLDAVKRLVPRLQEGGYRFVPLPDVPD